ncbi:hypothetical protein K0M31_007311, partial [Melipona bicolor]
ASKVSKADGWSPVVVRSKFGEMKQPGETLSKDNGAAGYKVGNGVKFPLKTQFSNSVSSIFIADRVGESVGTDGMGEGGMVSEENRSYAPLFLTEIHFRGNSSLAPLYRL